MLVVGKTEPFGLIVPATDVAAYTYILRSHDTCPHPRQGQAEPSYRPYDNRPQPHSRWTLSLDFDSL